MNKVVVITGGNGKLGRSLSKKFSDRGDTVIHLVRSNLESSKEFLKTLGDKHTSFLCSIKDSQNLKSVSQQIQRQEGRVDILINCAAINSSIRINDWKNLSDDVFDSIITNNLRGTFSVIREFKYVLSRAKNPVIINISSMSASVATKSNLAYSTSKAGIESMTRTLAHVFKDSIRINSVSPSWIKPEDYIEDENRNGERYTTNEDVCDLVVKLCEENNQTGETFVLSGGYPYDL